MICYCKFVALSCGFHPRKMQLLQLLLSMGTKSLLYSCCFVTLCVIEPVFMGFFFCDFPLFYIRIAYVFFFLIIVKILEFSLLETRTKTDLCFVCATDHTFLASFLVIPKIFSAGFGQPMDL